MEENRNKTRTAVCMYGFLRTYEITSASLIKHILEKNEADLFIFCPQNVGTSIIPQNVNITEYKIKNSKRIENQDSAGQTITEDKLQQIYGKYLKKCTIYNYSQDKFDKVAKNIEGYGVIPTNRVCSMLYNISGALKLLLDYCTENNDKYDCVILLRPDLAFYSDLNIRDIDLEQVTIPIGGGRLNNGREEVPQYFVEYYKNAYEGELIQYDTHPFTDQFIISSFDNMKVLANLYDKINDYAKKKFPFHPESILYYELCYKPQKSTHVMKDFLYEIFRNNYLAIENHMIAINMYDCKISVANYIDYSIEQLESISYQKQSKKNNCKRWIKNIVKIILMPLKILIRYIKRLLKWLIRE